MIENIQKAEVVANEHLLTNIIYGWILILLSTIQNILVTFFHFV